MQLSFRILDWKTNNWVLVASEKKIQHIVEIKTEFILFSLQDKFSFFYVYCFSTILDKFCWQAYIARYP